MVQCARVDVTEPLIKFKVAALRAEDPCSFMKLKVWCGVSDWRVFELLVPGVYVER